MKRHVPKRFRAGFTLIEIMVAMSVLAILVMMIGNIFQQVSDSWNIGTQSADANTAARAAMNFMAQELAQAVAGPIEVAPGVPPNKTHLQFEVNNGDEMMFVTLTGEPKYYGQTANSNCEALRGALFRWQDYQLRYWRNTETFRPYDLLPKWDTSRMLITNVVDFQVYVYADFDGLANTGAAPITCTFSDELPLCVDLYLEILSEGDMARWKSLGEDDEFRQRNAQCYSTRVYFQNRRGYAAR